MPSRSISLSVRLTQEESETLARLNFPDARTPSDKIRALIAAPEESFGSLEQGTHTFAARKLLKPASDMLDQNQNQSDTLRLLTDRLPLLLGELANRSDQGDLKETETAITEDFFELVELVLQAGLRRNPRLQNPELFKELVDDMRSSTELLRNRLNSK
ncbi:hypothetical protein PsAD2_02688 [Pseudovibrio axinellae]|uniref:Uncharacterized protein n=1 Tax=Pseudovibrio axinellae TaxID=989403 RepID=A0A165XQY9_9HYPH|nr:hypothetical protein [Pseudovibrio axinellae]KZL17955.1 hypothetical protein PsAD2_02688 [Pseudovibrio axinellae]SER15420.1 hypothetical protein SAMN05421798_106292 [Pseudovibrio axinellae]